MTAKRKRDLIIADGLFLQQAIESMDDGFDKLPEMEYLKSEFPNIAESIEQFRNAYIDLKRCKLHDYHPTRWGEL